MKTKTIYNNESMPNTTSLRLDEAHKVKYSWWSKPLFIIILTAILSTMDGLVLYSVFDIAMTQAWYMGIIMAFGIAVILNLIPIFEGKFVHRAIYRSYNYSLVLAVTALVAFLLLYGGTVYLRFTYEDMYGDTEQVSITNTLTSDGADNSSFDEEKHSRSRAIVILLALEPLATSICGFVLSYLSDDELEREIETTETQISDLNYEIAWKKAGIAAMAERNERLEMELTLEEEMYESEKKRLIAWGEVFKARSRQLLAMSLRDPEAISALSFEMDFNNSSTGSQLYQYPKAGEPLQVLASN